MKIGVGLPNQVRDVDPTVIPEWARLAEEAGFSTLGSVGRIAYPGLMDTVALAGAAAVTERIGLISNVMLTGVWPPALIAKEVAGIDGMSGGRLTLGIGIGGHEDDFVAEGAGPKGLGKRMDRDLEVYRSVWAGEPVGGGTNPAVPPGTRQVPMLFGGGAPAAFARMAKWGEGYIGPSLPAAMIGDLFDAARAAWRDAGREGGPRLVAIAYFALGDAERGRNSVADYYANLGEQGTALLTSGVRGTAAEVREAVRAFADLGADELVFNPTSDDVKEVARLAEIVL
ncbi:MAG TPA: LLM class flavin-dependent oxidoreductase [Umezawaea sp.]|nr:LLM class flavin-dependent oxidoreductase [Umezawaea sp.]